MVRANGHSRAIVGHHFTATLFGRLGILAFTGVLTLVGAVVGAPVAAAGGATVQLQVTSSTSTSVGYQVFANVYLAGATNPTGTVTFRLFGVNDPNCASAAVFTSNVAATGPSATSDHFTTGIAGTYHWEASYSGDPNNSAAGPTSCSDTGASVDVARFSSNLSLSAGQPYGGTIRASAAVYGYKPNGTVTFSLTPPGDVFCSGLPIFTSTVAVNGSGTYTSAPFTFLIGGLFKWRATYSGDGNNLAFPVTSCLDASSSVAVPPFATFTYPSDGQANVDSGTAFTWQTIPQASAYFLYVGTTVGGSDLAWSGRLPASQSSYNMVALPAGPLYATIYTQVNGIWSGYNSVAFTAIPTQAALTSPTSGQTGVDPSAPITWSDVPGTQGYALWVGTTYAGADVLGTPMIPATQSSYTPASPLPAGKTLYVILFTEHNGGWTRQAVTFSTAGSSGDSPSVLNGLLRCPGGGTIPSCLGT